MFSELDCRFSCLGLSQDHCTIGQETVKMPLSTHKTGEGCILGIRLYDFSFPLLHVDIT